MAKTNVPSAELQNLGVVAAEVRRPWILAGVRPSVQFAVAGNPDEIVVVDEDAVLPSWPVASLRCRASFFQKAGIAGAAPGLLEVARLVELQH